MKCTEPVTFPMPQITDDPTPSGPRPASKQLRSGHRTPSGRRCRLARKDSRSRFCHPHDLAEQQRHNGDRTEALLAEADAFQSAEGIHHSLGELYVLLAEDKISPRRAAVLAYINNLMLRTLPAIERGSTQIIFDLPRPRNTEPADASVTEIPAAIAHNAGPLADHQPRTTQPTNNTSTNPSDPPDPWDGYRPPKN